MSMKKERKEEELEMTCPMLKEDWWVFGHVDRLRLSEEEFRELELKEFHKRMEQAQAEQEEEVQRIRGEREAMRQAKLAEISAQRPGATPANPFKLDAP
jgi:dipeptidase